MLQGNANILAGWFGNLEELLERCSDFRPDEPEIIADLYALLSDAPREVCDSPARALPEPQLRALLEAKAFESAALRLIGRCGYVMSRSRSGDVIATLVLPVNDQEYTYSGRTEAAALCGALAVAVRDVILE